ncbi:MAG: hypothetical protein RIA62_07200 [Cyclobacteriaceae bacterium]
MRRLEFESPWYRNLKKAQSGCLRLREWLKAISQIPFVWQCLKKL